MMKQNPFPEERKKREEGRQAPEPPPERRFPEERKKREEPAKHDGTEPLS
jgi:hypothetical protein